MSAAPAPSPVRIFETLNAYQHSFLLKAAIDFDVFTAIGDGVNTAASLASRCRTSEKGMRVLCDSLTAADFLAKSNSTYSLTPDSAAFLNAKSPAYLGRASGFMLNDTMLHAFTTLEAAVRLGGTTLSGDGTVSEENPVWVDFAHGMGPMMFPAAQDIATRIVPETGGSPKKVLDIAAGHGMFGISIAQHHPDASITALDWAPVLAVARENAARFGLADRIEFLPGDAFTTDFGSGYDLVLITNFLHHFDIGTNTDFLRKVKRAMAPGGRAITLEFVPAEDRVSPPLPALFAMTMLVTTRTGDAYTHNEFKQMFGDAGFTGDVDCFPVQGMPESILVARA